MLDIADIPPELKDLMVKDTDAVPWADKPKPLYGVEENTLYRRFLAQKHPLSSDSRDADTCSLTLQRRLAAGRIIGAAARACKDALG